MNRAGQSNIERYVKRTVMTALFQQRFHEVPHLMPLS